MDNDKETGLEKEKLKLIVLLMRQYYKNLEKKRARRNLWNMFCVGLMSATLSFAVFNALGDLLITVFVASATSVLFHYTIEETFNLFLPNNFEWDVVTEDKKDEK
tara:strand:+ start:226 stop:540 length:315 start_codon:yes stop_codon:yes gene_type:complete